mgnify:CR=1 FL=1|jgi:hypothetical protein
MRTGVGISLIAAAFMAGCASVPTGPDVMVLPGTGKSFDEFRTDDMVCRDFAYRQVGGKAGEDVATSAAVRNAAIGTAVGAVAGAVIGGRDAAGVGAGTGLIIGSVSGAEASRGGTWGNQRRYDNAYVQCMYAKGHRVPVSGHYTPASPPNPPPPPGSPPPPPVR